MRNNIVRIASFAFAIFLVGLEPYACAERVKDVSDANWEAKLQDFISTPRDVVLARDLGPRAIAILAERLRSTSEFPLKMPLLFALANALREIQAPPEVAKDGVEAVREMLKSPNPNIRLQAASLYGGLQFAEGEDDLLLMLNDSDESVRAIAVETLGQVGDQRAADAMRQILASRRVKIGTEAAQNDSVFKFGATSIIEIEKRVREKSEIDARTEEMINESKRVKSWTSIRSTSVLPGNSIVPSGADRTRHGPGSSWSGLPYVFGLGAGAGAIYLGYLWWRVRSSTKPERSIKR